MAFSFLCWNISGDGLFHTSDLVVGIDQNDLGLESLDFFVVHQAVSADDQQIAKMGTTCSCTVQGNFTAAAFSRNDVGGEAFAVVDVV